ncbi:hypothetical protein WAI453_012456 [Rhynchosporium graminicola]
MVTLRIIYGDSGDGILGYFTKAYKDRQLSFKHRHKYSGGKRSPQTTLPECQRQLFPRRAFSHVYLKHYRPIHTGRVKESSEAPFGGH